MSHPHANPKTKEKHMSSYTSMTELDNALKSKKVSIEDYLTLKDSIVAKANPLRLKISPEKGCVCLYGVNSRFPVALYAAQWERVLDFGPSIKKFIADNAKELAKHAK